MKYEIIDSPDFALLRVNFENGGEKFISESGAMVAMDPTVKMETSMRGGMLAAAKRKLLGGESIFQNTYTSSAAGQKAFFAPAPEGDLRARELGANESIFLQSGAYVGHIGEELNLDTKFGGVKNFFGGVGLFMLKITGPGTVFFASYGALHEVDINNDTYICDNGNLVGFSEGLEYDVKSFGGVKSFFFSGEGLVCHFRGTGKLWLQTRNPPTLAAFLEPFRRVQKSN